MLLVMDLVRLFASLLVMSSVTFLVLIYYVGCVMGCVMCYLSIVIGEFSGWFVMLLVLVIGVVVVEYWWLYY